jgi:translation initiation factor IF-3
MQVYLTEGTFVKIVRIAEGRAQTGSKLAESILTKAVETKDRRAREVLGLPEP